jgi:uncharacterized protein YndB with AHSA1/START domain
MLAAAALASEDGYRAVVKEVVVAADAMRAWSLWTTNEGFQSFFPSATMSTNIALRPGGPYEVFLIPDAPAGRRGCDGCVILGYQEGRMLSFTWTNTPDMAVRPHRTHVVLTFTPIGAAGTRVRLVQDGWGTGPDWDVAFRYFDSAWARVLDSYKARLEAAPQD